MISRTPIQIRDIVLAKVAECSPRNSEITDSTTLGQLRFDSLDVVELQLLLEMEFGERRDFAFDDVQDAWTENTTIAEIVARTQHLLGVSA